MRRQIGGRPDVGRIAEAVSRPGIDPRIWCSLCAVDKVVIDDDGMFADVHILSTATIDDDGNAIAQKETVRVAPSYAGDGFGLYMPIQEGDEVVVVWPDGNPDHGGILVSRLWSASDPPPGTAKDNANDVLLMAKKDINVRIVTQGGGNVVLKVEDGKVLLGDESGNEQFVALANKTNQNFTNLWTIFDNVFGAASTPLVTPAPGSPDPVYTAVKAVVATLVALQKMPPPDVDAEKVKAL